MYTESKRNIQQKYARMRAEDAKQPEVDPEIEKIKDDPRALHKLYQQRLKTVPRGNVRAVAEIKAQFRAKGLNL